MNAQYHFVNQTTHKNTFQKPYKKNKKNKKNKENQFINKSYESVKYDQFLTDAVNFLITPIQTQHNYCYKWQPYITAKELNLAILPFNDSQPMTWQQKLLYK